MRAPDDMDGHQKEGTIMSLPANSTAMVQAMQNLRYSRTASNWPDGGPSGA